jgi:hypothetical protein
LAVCARPSPPPPLPPPEFAVAIRAWKMLGNTLDWAGLDTVAALLGVDDQETLIHDLTTIRDNL